MEVRLEPILRDFRAPDSTHLEQHPDAQAFLQTSLHLRCSLALPACLTQYHTHRLCAVHNALKQEGGRLSVILCHQAAVCCDWGELVRKDPLIERDQIAVPRCFAEAGEL